MTRQVVAAAATAIILSASAAAQLTITQPRVGNQEYSGAFTSVTMHIPAHGGNALHDTEAIVVNLLVVDNTGAALFPAFNVTPGLVGSPIAYDNNVGNNIVVDLSLVAGLAPVFANAAVAGLQFEVKTLTGMGFLVAAFSADESIDEVAAKDIVPPVLTAALRNAAGTSLYLVFSERLSSGDSANSLNQTIIDSITGADLQFNTTNFFDGTQPSPIGLSNPVFADFPIDTTVRFGLAAITDAVVGNYIRPAYSNASTTSANGFRDIVKNKATAAAVRIRLGTPNCPADTNGDGVVNSTDLGLLLGAWNTNNPSADVNHDGTVNSTDLGLLLGGWGACPQSA